MDSLVHYIPQALPGKVPYEIACRVIISYILPNSI